METEDKVLNFLETLDDRLIRATEDFAELGEFLPNCARELVLESSGETKVIADLFEATKSDPEGARHTLQEMVALASATAGVYQALLDHLDGLYEA